MTQPRPACETVRLVDEYCAHYTSLFKDVRSFEHLKLLHIGIISNLPRKSLPAIARLVGESHSQGLHHFLAEAEWDVEALQAQRIALTRQVVGDHPIVLCIDETGDKKKGKKTDYVSRQYIGNLGKVENGVVSVNAYGVIDNITIPLYFKIFKPRKRLKETDTYKTKPTLAVELIHQVQAAGFTIELVLADRLYGESSDFIATLGKLDLNFVVAIRDNHGVWMMPGQRIRFTWWRSFDRIFSDESIQTPYIREVVYGKRRTIRYFQLTTDPEILPTETTCFLITNLAGNVRKRLGNDYGLRTWIEYGFKQVKNEMGWADYRLTCYPAIERWWQLIFSAYLMIDLHTPTFQQRHTTVPPLPEAFIQHPWWSPEPHWKATLNNLRLIIQPFVSRALILPWLVVFPMPDLAQALQRLVACINGFP
jgi:SRSO17 transposase